MSYSKIFQVETFMSEPDKVDLNLEIRMTGVNWNTFNKIMSYYRGQKDVTVIDASTFSTGSAVFSFKADKANDSSWQDEYYLDDRDLT